MIEQTKKFINDDITALMITMNITDICLVIRLMIESLVVLVVTLNQLNISNDYHTAFLNKKYYESIQKLVSNTN